MYISYRSGRRRGNATMRPCTLCVRYKYAYSSAKNAAAAGEHLLTPTRRCTV